MSHNEPDYRSFAWNMVDQQLRRRGISDPVVLDAMGHVPRHRFVPDTDLKDAYADRALPTTEGQTISQPYMVAMMTERLQVKPGMRVLEIGTGSGYQTAILAQLGASVVTIDQSLTLTQRARHILEELGYADCVTIIEGDGTLGYLSQALYDRVIVTAGAPHLPQAYKDQLADPGCIVIPIGSLHDQKIHVYDRRGDDWTETHDTACRFVPLIGQDGWSREDVAPGSAGGS